MARSTRNGATSSTASGARVIRPMLARSNFTPQPPRRTNPFSEIGTSGLRQFSGWVMDEWLGELTGREAAWRYREFLDNDPVAGGFLFAVEMLARRVTWSVEGGDPKWREFIAQCMNDMSHPWVDLVSEALTMLPYGYAPMELVYKRRQGGSPRGQLASNTPATEEPQDEASSVYNDGLIGWRKIPLRAQETTLHWDFDGYSSLRGLIQLDWHGQQHNIPIEKMVLFRYRKIRNNPEGYSVLRRAWTSYFRLRGLQDIEAIGAARDLAGIPVAKPPPGVDLFAPENQELYNRVVELVTTVHRDEDEGLVFPTSEWEFELMSAGGSRQFDTDKIIRRYEQRIAASVLADFMLLGQDGLGSYAMVDVKSELFGMAIDAVLDAICEPMNRYAIPRLLKLNGIETNDPPQITHTTAGRIDLEKIGSFLNNLALAGAQIPWDRSLMTQLFNAAGLPMSFDTPQVEKPGGLENEPVEKKPLEKGEGLSLVHSVRGCARCGEDHDSLSFRKLGHSVDGDPPLEYWATCPETDEPIMLGHTSLEKAEGTLIEVGPALAARHRVLSSELDRRIAGALSELGSRAASAYAETLRKDERPSKREIRSLVAQIMRTLNVSNWVRERLRPLLNAHGQRVAQDVERTLSAETELDLKIGEKQAQQVGKVRHLNARDIEPQIRKAILEAIEQGVAAGENPSKTAERIRKHVPAGRFVHAGTPYRSELIARDQTANMMRAASLAAYKSNRRVSGIKARDGIYGPPRSDQACIDRDGKTYPLSDPPAPFHALCTLSYDPLIQTPEADLTPA